MIDLNDPIAVQKELNDIRHELQKVHVRPEGKMGKLKAEAVRRLNALQEKLDKERAEKQ